MRISDWSAVVCSSDLYRFLLSYKIIQCQAGGAKEIRMTARRLETRPHPDDRNDPGKTGPQVLRHVTVNVAESPFACLAARGHLRAAKLGEIGRASCRVRVCQAAWVARDGDKL